MSIPTHPRPSFVLSSPQTGTDYPIFLDVPADQPGPWPAVLFLDGDDQFRFAVQAAHLARAAGDIPPTLLVGVGYGASYTKPGNQRLRDYTPTAVATEAGSGGAGRLGQIPEAFRSWPGVKRSAHPALSFCAWGKHSDTVTRNHELHNSHGEGSPLARLYELNAHVLLEGVGHDRNTSLHLAEYRAEWPSKHVVDQGAAMFIDGQRTWATYHEVLFAPADFPRIGAAFEATGACGTGKIGNAPAKLMSQVALIDFASDWIHAHRR